MNEISYPPLSEPAHLGKFPMAAVRRVAVDFSFVEEKHRKIDGRLINWARWCFGSTGGAGTAPMFALYRSAEEWGEEQAAPVIPIPVDPLDAMKIQKAMHFLPEKHRKALTWNYLSRTGPRMIASELSVTTEGLAGLIRNGRQMLLNHGV